MQNRDVCRASTFPKPPGSPRSVQAVDDCETRAALVRALGDAARAGIERGDACRVRVAAQALAALTDDGGGGPVIDLATERARRG